MPSYRPEISALVNLPFSFRSGWVALLLVGAAVSGCAPEIGDSCTSALDCSSSGKRLCDRTQRGGYCTLEGCEEGTCPEEAVCVEFGRQVEGQPVDRLSRLYCMYKCESSSDCRTDEQYDCFTAREFGARDEARVLGSSAQRFCAPIAPEETAPPRPRPDAGAVDAAMSMPEEDAGMSLPQDPDQDDAGASE
jgi:hypothetical protein